MGEVSASPFFMNVWPTTASLSRQTFGTNAHDWPQELRYPGFNPVIPSGYAPVPNPIPRAFHSAKRSA